MASGAPGRGRVSPGLRGRDGGKGGRCRAATRTSPGAAGQRGALPKALRRERPSGPGIKLHPTGSFSLKWRDRFSPALRRGWNPVAEGTAPARASRNSRSRFTRVTAGAPRGGEEGGVHTGRKEGEEGSRHWRQLGRSRSALT